MSPTRSSFKRAHEAKNEAKKHLTKERVTPIESGSQALLARDVANKIKLQRTHEAKNEAKTTSHEREGHTNRIWLPSASCKRCLQQDQVPKGPMKQRMKQKSISRKRGSHQ